MGQTSLVKGQTSISSRRKGGGVVTSLGPTTATFTFDANPGSLIVLITGSQDGETITGVTPNDGRLAIAGSGTQLVVGLSASSAGAIAAVLTSSTGRTLNMAITVGVAPLRVVATRGEIQADVAAGARTSANNAQSFRIRIFAGAGGIEANSMQIHIPNFTVTAAGEIDGSADKIGGHIEFGGVAYSSSWDGVQLGNIPGGDPNFGSDTITHPYIPEGTPGWVYLYREFEVDGQPIYVFTSGASPSISGEISHQGAVGTVANRIGTAGTLANGGGWSSNSTYCPAFAIIDKQKNKDRAIVAVGASLEKFQADRWGDGANGAGAYMRRGLNPVSGKKFAYISLARAGEDAFFFLANSVKRRQWFKYGNTGFNGYGGNDFTNGRTTAATLTDFATIKAEMTVAGIEDFIYSRMVAKTDSSDQWLTPENQTIRTRAGGFFLDFHANIDAGVQAQGYRLCDLSSYDEDPNFPGKWKSDGSTPNLSCNDGTHRSVIRHAGAGGGLRSYLVALPPLAS